MRSAFVIFILHPSSFFFLLSSYFLLLTTYSLDPSLALRALMARDFFIPQSEIRNLKSEI